MKVHISKVAVFLSKTWKIKNFLLEQSKKLSNFIRA